MDTISARVAAPVPRWTMHRSDTGSEKGRFFELLVTFGATYRRLGVAGVRRCGSPLVQRSNILFYTTQLRSHGGRRTFVDQLVYMVVYDSRSLHRNYRLRRSPPAPARPDRKSERKWNTQLFYDRTQAVSAPEAHFASREVVIPMYAFHMATHGSPRRI